MDLLKNFLLMIFLLIELVWSAPCPKVVCNSNAKPFINGTCVNHDPISNIITLNPCSDYQSCFSRYDLELVSSFSENLGVQNMSCLTWPLSLSEGLPNIDPSSGSARVNAEGDACSVPGDCVSRSCNSNYMCKGESIGSYCDEIGDCTASAYCNASTQTCAPRKPDGASCTIDEECQNTSGCVGVCTAKYSIPAGVKVNSSRSTGELRIFCISYYMNSDKVCEDLILQGQAPYSCEYQGTCNYTTSISKKPISIKDFCNCDYSTNKAYCRFGTNTFQYLSYIESLLSVLSYPCHYTNQGECYLVPGLARWNKWNASMALYNFQSYPDSIHPCIVPKDYPPNIGKCIDRLGLTCTLKQAVPSGSDQIRLPILLLLIAISLFINL